MRLVTRTGYDSQNFKLGHYLRLGATPPEGNVCQSEADGACDADVESVFVFTATIAYSRIVPARSASWPNQFRALPLIKRQIMVWHR